VKLIERLLAHLLSLAIGLSIVLGVLANTLGTAEFWNNAADKSRLYAGLATAVPGGNAAYFRDMIQPIPHQLIAHYRTGGPIPTIKIAPTSLDQAAAIAVPPVPILNAEADAAISRVLHYGTIVFWGALVTAVVLAVIIALTMRGRRLNIYIRAFGWCTVSTAMSAVALFFLPMLGGLFLGSPELAPVQTVLTNYLSEIGAQLGFPLAIIAGGLLAITVGLMVTRGYLKVHGKFFARADAPS
jgi:hypothetical protein